MNASKRPWKMALVAGTVVVAGVFLNLAWAATPSPAQDPDKQTILQQVQNVTVPGVLQAVTAAREAIKAGHTEQALAELQKAEQALKVIQTSLAQVVGPKFANTTCPIMGSAIDPAKVPDSLTRTFKGQKIAFCCSGCPVLWDKLTDAQKEAKLKASQIAKGS